MRAAGCVVNDMWDRDLDARVRRTAGRPLASGALRLRQAAVFLVLLLGAGLAVLLQLNRTAEVLGCCSLLLVAVYPLAKRFTWWPQLVMGATFGVGAPVGYAAATGQVDDVCLAIYAAAILWDLGFDTIYGFQDMEDERGGRRAQHLAPVRPHAAALCGRCLCRLRAGAGGGRRAGGAAAGVSRSCLWCRFACWAGRCGSWIRGMRGGAWCCSG